MRRWLVGALMIICWYGSVRGQDPQFSQFYAAPTYLNPAFAGGTIQHRFIMNYRHQWPSIPGAFTSYNFSYDNNLEDVKSGLGLLFTRDKAGSGGLRFTNVAGQYSFRLQLKRHLYIKSGIQFGLTTRDIDFNRLTFGDQLVRGGGTSDGINTSEVYAEERVTYPDFGSGLLLFDRKFWFGVSAHHLNKPNESLLQQTSILPVKYSVHGGYRFRVKEERKKKGTVQHDVVAALNYKAQDKFDQIDLGVYYEYSPLIIGLWYRGIPGFKAYQPGYQNNDAIIALVGYEVNGLRIGYSYDLTVSRLVTNTAGSHEISMVYEVAKRRRKIKLKRQVVPCAKF